MRSSSEAETRAIARAVAAVLVPGDVVTLDGPLGAGKTVFVRGLAEALGVPADARVSSPSYAIVHLYDGGRLPLAHLDLYRLGDEDELEGVGLRDLLAGDRVLLVEWPDRAPSLEGDTTLKVALRDEGRDARVLALTALVPELEAALEAALAPWAPVRGS